ncbi:TlpA family protein disulfide reductase [Pedobacter hiemivivus]|uniref:TlpA family protein disulfide reductase n=1 Tax=Pedobacter hiemivivus TaxID=2530454 RepID=A0A4U1GBW6_9SPHI|nr:TlpA disulfide reductase family protein [Pedobacter hiemivivus]TKC61461.1 TlpA family protein disulfide reductase [Pedobacter hiemivivus]
MKLKLFLRCFALLILASSGLRAVDKPSGKIRFNVTVNCPDLQFVEFSHLKDQDETVWEREMIMPKVAGKVLIKKDLPFALQIISLNHIPVFISGPQEVNLMIRAKSRKVLPTVDFNSVDGFRQSLPYQMDSLYEISADKLAKMNVEDLVGILKNLDDRVDALLKKAGVVKPAELSLLQRYAGLLRMKVKHTYLKGHKDNSTLPGNFSDWYLKGEGFKGTELGRICDEVIVQNYLVGFEEGRALINPKASRFERWEPILQDKNQFLIKKNVIPNYYTLFRTKGLTQELNEFYPKIRIALTNAADIKAFDQFYHTYENLQMGKPAPDFALPDADGKLVRLSDFRGKMLVIDCWGTWCGECRETLPLFRAIAANYKDSSDVAFITIALEQKDGISWRDYLKEHNMEQEINLHLVDGSKDHDFFRDIYKMNSYPRYIVLDRKGNFLDSHLEHPNQKIFKEKIDQWYKEKR